MFDDIENTNQQEVPQAETPETFEHARAHYNNAVYQEAIKAKEDRTNAVLKTVTSRFSDAIPLRKLEQAHIVVVGGGGIGSPTVKNLVAMGAKNVTVIDDDTVEPQNIGTQFHKITNLGMPKVAALQQDMLDRYFTRITTIQARVTSLAHLYELVSNTKIDILIGAVDNMEFRNAIGRQLVVQSLENSGSMRAMYDTRLPSLYIDCRMSLGLWHVFALPVAWMAWAYIGDSLRTRTSNEYKKEALFPQEEAVEEPCTARALGYTGENIASYISALVDFWLRLPNAHGENDTILRKFMRTDIRKNEEVPFKWKTGFDARSFACMDSDPFVEKLKKEKNSFVQDLEKTIEVNKKIRKDKIQLVQTLRDIARSSGCFANSVEELTEHLQPQEGEERGTCFVAVGTDTGQFALMEPGTTIRTVQPDGEGILDFTMKRFFDMSFTCDIEFTMDEGRSPIEDYSLNVRRLETLSDTRGYDILAVRLPGDYVIIDVIPPKTEENEADEDQEESLWMEPQPRQAAAINAWNAHIPRQAASINVWNGYILPQGTSLRVVGGHTGYIDRVTQDGVVIIFLNHDTGDEESIYATTRSEFQNAVRGLVNVEDVDALEQVGEEEEDQEEEQERQVENAAS